MRMPHYEKCIHECVASLERQTAKLEIIISEHPVDRFIRKNELLNKGLKKANCDIVWHCDADFTLDDKTVLERMVKRLDDVIYPFFYSAVHRKMKIADGGPLIRKNVLERFGPLDESAIGISWVTFPLLKWCMEKTKFQACIDFIVNHNHLYSVKKGHHKTRSRLRQIYKTTISDEKYKMYDMR